MIKYVVALVMALSLVTAGYASNCNVGNLVSYSNRQLVSEHYAAPVRERIVVEYAEVPLVKETVRDYYGNEVQRVVDRSRNKELVRVERERINNHHHNQQQVRVEKVVVEKQIVKRDRESLRDRLANRRNKNQNVKQVKEVRIEQVRGGY